jgi:hypothetical protein
LAAFVGLSVELRSVGDRSLGCGLRASTADIDLPGDGGGDECGAALGEERDDGFGVVDERVDLLRLAIEECGDGALFCEGRERRSDASKKSPTHSITRSTAALPFHVPEVLRRTQHMHDKARNDVLARL